MTHSVFLSSTFGDFESERSALREAIPYAGIYVRCAESEGRDPLRSLVENLENWIDKSEAVVLLVGLRYGSKSDDGESWTEKEVRYALRNKKKVFCYLRKHPEIGPRNIEVPLQRDDLVRFIKGQTTQFHRYNHGQIPSLIAMVIRDLDRWARGLDLEAYRESYNQGF